MIPRFFFHTLMLVLFGTCIPASAFAYSPVKSRSHDLVFATCCLSYDQEKKASILINGLRDLGGPFSDCPVYVVVHDTSRYSFSAVRKEHVIVVQLTLPAEILNYPFAFKAFAAGKVEEMISRDRSFPDKKVRTLAWFDPESLILAPPDDLELSKQYEAALRPVYLFNGVGIRADSMAGAYWGPVLKAAGVDEKSLFEMETVVDEVPMKAYLNCGIFSVDPGLGVCREWASLLREMITDQQYQHSACITPFRRIFLHQVAFTTAVIKNIQPDKIHWLPMTCGYPLDLHERVPEKKQVTTLNDIQCAITEDRWRRDPDWMSTFTIQEPLKTWLEDAYLDFLKVTNHVYRFEGSCNAILVTTPGGSVLIDPAGVGSAERWFRRIMQEYPLKAILLTHGHHDHRKDIFMWKGDQDIPVIAQREIVEFIRYHDRLAPFFAHRNRVWGISVPDSVELLAESPVEPTVLYTDTCTYELGGIHFQLTHVGGETPDQSVIWIPDYNVVLAGDNYYSSFPNLYTLRGTKPRWALEYIAALDTMLAKDPEFIIPGHGDPLTEKRYARITLKRYRDAIQYVHDATVKGINEGVDKYTLMTTVSLPDSLSVPQFYGNVPWSVRGIYEGYIGWFDESPESMYGLDPASVYPDLLKLAGIDQIVNLAKEYLKEKDYKKVLQVTGILESANQQTEESRSIRLEALESLKSRSRNYIENIWLDHWIREIQSESW